MKLELVDRRREPTWRLASEEWARLCRLCAPLGRPEWLCDLVLAEDADVADLNERFRQARGVTDVLAFSYLIDRGPGRPALVAGTKYARCDLWLDPPSAEKDTLAGEIVLAANFVADRCRDHGWSLSSEVALLTVHGALHILGWEHGEAADRAIMHAQEREILAREGLEHPLSQRGSSN